LVTPPLNCGVRRQLVTIAYSSSIEHLDHSELSGFLAHWDIEPPTGTLFEILSRSSEVILARDVESSVLCGYITALSDGVACAYISALEVRLEYRRKGIGTVLLNQMVDRLDVSGIYLSCAPALVPFYEAAGFKPGISMGKRKRGYGVA
jgi:GNAT superfamily N-acetyltransferase